ncbi:hypothetical protein L7F22_007525 [Adiantum nelumboides]|nr:hypothetical protein [Adiantum nelumboides]
MNGIAKCSSSKLFMRAAADDQWSAAGALNMLARSVIKTVMAGTAWILQHISEKKREKLGDKLTPIAIFVIDSVGAAVGNLGERLRSNDLADFQNMLAMTFAGFDDSSTDPECDFKDVKDLALCVNMATSAYKDESIAEQKPVDQGPKKSKCFVSFKTQAYQNHNRDRVKDVTTYLTKDMVPIKLYDASHDIVYEAVAYIRAHEGFQLAFQDVTKTSRCHKDNNQAQQEYLFVISKPDVFKSPASDTYIIFGEAKIEDLSSQLQTQAVEQFKARAHAPGVSKAEPSTAYEADEDEEVDEAGIEPKDIELVMIQAGVSRSKAVTALRSADGDIVSAIMELTT